MAQDRWYIAGYDGTRQFFAKTYSASSIDEAGVRTLLKVLYGKFLSAEEISGSFGSDQFRYAHLDVTEDQGSTRRVLMIGENPHFTASFFRADEKDDPLGESKFGTVTTAPWQREI